MVCVCVCVCVCVRVCVYVCVCMLVSERRHQWCACVWVGGCAGERGCTYISAVHVGGRMGVHEWVFMFGWGRGMCAGFRCCFFSLTVHANLPVFQITRCLRK